MARRVATLAFIVAGIISFSIRPLVGFIVLGVGVTLILDGRGLFGRGIFRAGIAFIAGLWLALAGVVATLLGMIPPDCTDTNAAVACAPTGARLLFLPGVLLLGLGFGLIGWSVVTALRARRRHRRWPDAG